MNEYLLTSEAVTEGHPDKICDQISDAILDAYLLDDKHARVAIEVMASNNTIMIAGEATAKAKIDLPEIARSTIKNIGYTSTEYGLDYKKCLILTNVNQQSPDIAQGVNQSAEVIGAGDQGIMYGYACNETETYMPITIYLANKLAMRLATVRKESILPWLFPDGKTQVTMQYNDKDEPVAIKSIIISAQHHSNLDTNYIHKSILNEVVYTVIDSKWLTTETKIYINPTGSFVIGGPAGDTGVTGRKIIADTYGGIAKHGGGAFSGKDPTKVDRSGAYMARYVAKNIVASGLATKCEVSLAYAIGLAEPEMVRVNTFGTGRLSDENLSTIINDVFSFSVKGIIDQLDLSRPQYLKTSVYGHFGKENYNFEWEKLTNVRMLKLKAIETMAGML